MSPLPLPAFLRSAAGLAGRMLDIVFPRYCAVCGKMLATGERHVCTTCFVGLPFTRFRGAPGNVVERLFWGRIPIERANALLRYRIDSASRHIFFKFKYHDRPDVGHFFGRVMARDLCSTGFFDGIDVIVPLPLHPHKERNRGYNQSEALARGVAAITGLSVLTGAVARIIDTPTQTHLTPDERRRNVHGAFRLVRPEAVTGRHVLLVDDVLTTNATLMACAEAMLAADGVRFSILVLGLAGRHPAGGHSFHAWWREEPGAEE